MTDQVHVVPANLREAARHHREVSDYLRTIPSTHAAIQDSLDSLGPIFAELREAGRDLLEQRRQCYELQADAHAAMAHNLEASADMWEQHEAAAASRLERLRDDGR
ncbi:ESX-1 secretion-associated protein [Mycobacterium sp. SM1]|uniref:ESX-1 secretion-associated protein n=1 Tax=Mycobacterium sp. SM1 TaxID=2816243 RepID=UPI001BCE5E68|nr:ESX-1 secretion-associated protein [Mycobacterium sp. SM1]MBS4728086.1 ESX-1 secretion-associated protein [Mycobacterium sp. SM1]